VDDETTKNGLENHPREQNRKTKELATTFQNK
jgi:hypothetical protein